MQYYCSVLELISLPIISSKKVGDLLKAFIYSSAFVSSILHKF